MRRWVVLLLCCGCRQLLGFESVTTTDDAVVVPDAGPCGALAAECISDVLRQCTAIGEEPTDTLCGWGCIDDGTPHCGVHQPTGGVVTAADLADDVALQDVEIASTSQIDTATGEISGLRPGGTGVMAGIDFFVRDGVAIFRSRSLRVAADVQVVGDPAIAMVSLGDIEIAGVVDARGGCAGRSAGPGGSDGGEGAAGEGAGAGQVGTSNGATGNGGGGGGGAGVVGSPGGAGTNAPGGMNGPASGDFQISSLIGGSGGGGGGGMPSARGGGGGGAIQLISATRITVTTGAGINASGCGGERPIAPNTLGGGGGGGAGGTIVLEAPQIVLEGGLAVNGGAGGGGSTASTDGEDGPLARSAAVGGINTGQGGTGGRGGATADLSGNAGTGDDAGGGGGGAVGWIRLLTRAGMIVMANGFTSPDLSDNSSATQGTATIQ